MRSCALLMRTVRFGEPPGRLCVAPRRDRGLVGGASQACSSTTALEGRCRLPERAARHRSTGVVMPVSLRAIALISGARRTWR